MKAKLTFAVLCLTGVFSVQAVTISCTRADLTISIENSNVKKSLVSSKGRDYKVKGNIEGHNVVLKFKDKDTLQPMRLSFHEGLLTSKSSGVTAISINKGMQNCQFMGDRPRIDL